MTDMHEAWRKVQRTLPRALTTPESLWFHPDGTIYLDDNGATRFMLYLTANSDGSARVRFLDDGAMNYLHFRVGTAPNGLGEGYVDVVDAVRTALDRLGGRY